MKRKYPWNDWFGNAKLGTVTLRRGKDYKTPTYSMAIMIRNRAVIEGIGNLHVRITGDNSLEFWIGDIALCQK